MAGRRDEFPARPREQGGLTADLSIGIALLASRLDWRSRDPFDRLIAATALETGMTLASSDAAFSGLGDLGLRRIR